MTIILMLKELLIIQLLKNQKKKLFLIKLNYLKKLIKKNNVKDGCF